MLNNAASERSPILQFSNPQLLHLRLFATAFRPQVWISFIRAPKEDAFACVARGAWRQDDWFCRLRYALAVH